MGLFFLAPLLRAMILALLSLGAVSFVISLVATFVVKRVAIRIGFVDKPGHRKIHSKPIALGGGIAIFVAFALPMAAALLDADSTRDLAHIVTMRGARTHKEAIRLANEDELWRALHAASRCSRRRSP